MAEPGFVVGGRYASAAGEYDVLAIEDGSVRIRYTSGFEMTLPARGLWAQWEALVAQRSGRPVAPAGAASATRMAAAPRTRASATATASQPRMPKPRKGTGGEAGFFTSVGYLAAGCELTAMVAGRDYPAFAQRYKILAGRNLVTPHAGLDVHERPTHRIGAELAVRFPADSHTLEHLDFGREAKIEPAEPGSYLVTRAEVVERLLKLGFDFGANSSPSVIRERVPAKQQVNFDRGLSVRRGLGR